MENVLLNHDMQFTGMRHGRFERYLKGISAKSIFPLRSAVNYYKLTK
jgi:hypothetical protein